MKIRRKTKESMTKKRKKHIKIYMALALVLLMVGLVAFLLSGGNVEIVKEVFRDGATREDVRESLEKFGWKGYITLGILSMLQVVLTFLPAEPVQVISGLSFGLWKGSLVCLAGVFVGNTVIFILYKIYGDALSEYFERHAEFDFSIARRSTKIALIIFILYFLPAIPYGLICLFTASLNIRYPKYIFLTTVGSIPSILMGVGLGHIAIAASWAVSVIVCMAIIVLLAVMVKYRSKLFNKVNEFMKKRQKQETLHTANRFVWGTLAFGSKLVYDRKVKVKFIREIKKLERPSIILYNHGSFIDFVYGGRLVRKERPHFVAARLYFYHKKLGKLLRYMGCIPKSMFASDVENVKACMRVLHSGEILAMMPEARLSTAGKFEGIQDSTYKFIKRANVPVYVVSMRGDYLASPKWGDGTRKGSYVETELKQLFKAGETETLSLEEMKAKIDEALYYDDFAWLETQPQVHYKSKEMAKGLENILYLCPECGARYTMKTEGDTITCEACGLQAKVGSRYEFIDEKPFKNFQKWYEWQSAETEKSALQDGYKMESKVELHHGSVDGKALTRVAGEGVCTLDKTGLLYKGTEDGKEIEKFFPMSQMYRLLFGAGVDFEIYEGKEIWFFVPENKRSCVEWYVASGVLKTADEASQQ